MLACASLDFSAPMEVKILHLENGATRTGLCLPRRLTYSRRSLTNTPMNQPNVDNSLLILSAQVISRLCPVDNTDHHRDKEMVRWFRALVALAEDPGLAPNTHMVVHNHL